MTETSLILFNESDSVYDDMLTMIAGAEERVWLETYIFSADEIGWKFAEALEERARAGVDVRLRVDSAGAMEAPYSKRIRHHLSQSGVDLRWFNRLRRLVPSRINHRDHRKLLLVDSRCVYIGSSNITRANSRRLCGDSRTRQLDVRVDGDLAKRMAEHGTALWEDRDNKEPNWQPVAEGESKLVASSPESRQPICELYRALFEQAESTAYLAAAYFVPDEKTIRVLVDATQRGVDVRLILPRHTDMPPTRWAAYAFYGRLLSAGIRIYEYLPEILHVKAAVVDARWATLGSGNFDSRSFFLNYELNLETRSAEFCKELQRVLIDDLPYCEEITEDRWSQRSWHWRVKEKLALSVRHQF